MTGHTALMGNSGRALRELASGVERRNRWTAVGGGVLGAVLGISYSVSPVLPLAILISGGVIFCVAQYPKSTLFVLLAAVCLFEQFPRDFPDSLTDRVPFFWNLNTAFEVYTHLNIKLIPLNVMEIFLIVAGLCMLARRALKDSMTFRVGTLLLPMLANLLFVVLALITGLTAGGDYRLAFQDVRAPVYLPLSYLLAVNLVEERRDLQKLLWLVALSIGLKGVLYTFRRYVTLAGSGISDQGVGSHEEVFLFNAFIVLLATLCLFDLHRRLRLAMLLLLPTVIIGSLACNRRAGIAVLIFALLVFALVSLAILTAQRRSIVTYSFVAVIGLVIYYQAFSSRSGLLAQPARAIRSQIQPDQRDADSDRYRELETRNLMATMRSSPVIGWGYGRPFLTPFDLSYAANAYPYWNIWPHNTVLAVWMRTGTMGFICFWVMIVAVLLRGCEVVRSKCRELAGLGLFTLLILVMWILLGYLDMGLSQFRTVLMIGIFAGVMDATCYHAQEIRAGAPETA